MTLLLGRIVPPARAPAAFVFLICFGLSAIAGSRTGQFSAGVSLVEVYATVTSASGALVTGLPREAFTVEEDGVAQTVTAFSAGDVPLSLAIGIDRSFSVPAERLRNVVAAVRELLDALRPDDRTLLLAIGSRPEVLAPLGASRADSRAALAQLDGWGSTPLHDAVTTAIDAIAPAGGRRALILLSDGNDRYSQASAGDVLAFARRRDVIVYPVAVSATRPALFAELASATGGRSFQATEARALRAALTGIAAELRAQYLLGYVPDMATRETGRWRKITVRVSTPGTRVRAREGYHE